jgi:cell division protein FtsL
VSLRPGATLILTLAVIGSSIGVVYARHEGRKLFMELQALGRQRDNMEVEWGQLQLEQGTLTTQGLIEKAARERLGMENLSTDNMVIVKP